MKNLFVIALLALLAWLWIRSRNIAAAGGAYEPSTGRIYTPAQMARAGLTPTGGQMTVQQAETAYNTGQIDYATLYQVQEYWGVS